MGGSLGSGIDEAPHPRSSRHPLPGVVSLASVLKRFALNPTDDDTCHGRGGVEQYL